MDLILWKNNYELDSNKVESVISKIKSDENTYDPFLKYNTTFFLQEKPELIFLDFYSGILKEATSDLSLYHRSSFSMIMWSQLYTNKSHEFRDHDHFSNNEILSWVHFVSPVSKKCFYFKDSNNNKVYPEQNKGDFIVFPSWAIHGVERHNEQQDRFVISGNISLNAIERETTENQKSICSFYQVNRTIGLWETSYDNL